MVRGFRWNVYDTFASNHDTASDNGSSLSLTSGSSDNCTSPSSLSPPVQTGDRCFVVTYGKLSQPEIPEKETRNVQMHSFPLSSSYSDDEAQMETKPVCTSISEVPADLVSAKKINAADQRTQDASEATIQGMQDVSNKDEFYCKGSELTSSTSSSVLVESLDSSSKPSQTTCITVTTCTATYSTLASPQSTRGESEGNSKEDGSDTSDHRLKFTRDDNHVWELRSTQHTHVRPRSPSPAQRRVSYLMATEGSSSLSSGNWIVKSVGNEETACNLMTVKEESNQNLSRVNRVYQVRRVHYSASLILLMQGKMS